MKKPLHCSSMSVQTSVQKLPGGPRLGGLGMGPAGVQEGVGEEQEGPRGVNTDAHMKRHNGRA